MAFPHRDTDGGVTAIYYANPVWEANWQGETVFYDERREPIHLVAPTPGRLAIFDGDIVHRVGAVSRVPRSEDLGGLQIRARTDVATRMSWFQKLKRAPEISGARCVFRRPAA